MKQYRLTPDSKPLVRVDLEELAKERNLNEDALSRLKSTAEDAAIDADMVFMKDEDSGQTYLVSKDGHYTHGYVDEIEIVPQSYDGERLISPTFRRSSYLAWSDYLQAVKNEFDSYSKKLIVSDPEAERRESMKTYLNSPVAPIKEIRTSSDSDPLTPVSKEDFLNLFGSSQEPTATNAHVVLGLLGLSVMRDKGYEYLYLVNGKGRYMEFQVSSIGFHVVVSYLPRNSEVVHFASERGFRDNLRTMFDEFAEQGVVTQVIPEPSAPERQPTIKDMAIQRPGVPTDVEYRLDEDDESPLRELQWNDFQGRYHLEGDPNQSMKMAEVVEEARNLTLIMVQDVNTGIPYLVNYVTGEYVPGMLRPDGIIIGNDFSSKVPAFRFRITSGSFPKDTLDYFKKHAQKLVVIKRAESAQAELKSEWHEDENGKWVHPRYPATGQVPHPRMKLSYREDSNDGVLFIDGAEVPLSFGELLDLREKVDKTISYCQSENRALWEEWYQLQTRREADKLGLDGNA